MDLDTLVCFPIPFPSNPSTCPSPPSSNTRCALHIEHHRRQTHRRRARKHRQRLRQGAPKGLALAPEDDDGDERHAEHGTAAQEQGAVAAEVAGEVEYGAVSWCLVGMRFIYWWRAGGFRVIRYAYKNGSYELCTVQCK